MCGIIGAFGKKDAFEIVGSGLEKIRERGRDGAGIFDGKTIQVAKTISELKNSSSENIIGQVLHAIVHTMPQPIQDDNHVLIANCEIYNWKELDARYNFEAQNDTVVLLKLLKKFGIKKTLELVHGVYSFCYWAKDDVYLARDIIGIKPLWYSLDKGLLFCSEKKAIEGNAKNIVELNPRTILHYNNTTKKSKIIKRPFFELTKNKDSEQEQIETAHRLLKKAVEMRIPDRKFGILLSGGIDSAMIAKMLKDSKAEFSAYVATVDESAEVEAARRIAADLKIPLKIAYVTDIHVLLAKVIPLIEDSNVVKAGVAATFYAACELAKKDDCKVIFSGIGSDELFAGYSRFKYGNLNTINKDCYSDILRFYERNAYRDDVITMHNNLELRIPFLDVDLVRYALTIDPSLKIKKEHNEIIEKQVVREIGKRIGLPGYVVQKKKKAAQYSSGVDKAMQKAAKEHGFASRSAYMDSFLPRKIMKLGALISGGKDSWFAAYLLTRHNYEIACLISIKSKNSASFMFHTPNVDLVSLQSKACGIPLIVQKTTGEKEKELSDLKNAIKKAKKEFEIEGIVSGALFSNYQRERIEKVCDELGLKIFSPLWHMDQELELRAILDNKFEIIFSSVAADGLDKSWLGVPITKEHIEKLKKLNKRLGLNIAGEGGEYESLVIDCPLFKKKIVVEKAELVAQGENTAHFVIKKAGLDAKGANISDLP